MTKHGSGDSVSLSKENQERGTGTLPPGRHTQVRGVLPWEEPFSVAYGEAAVSQKKQVHFHQAEKLRKKRGD